MCPEEVESDQFGTPTPRTKPDCDEAHYPRILRKHLVTPGPERALGAYRCPQCGAYFDENCDPMPL